MPTRMNHAWTAVTLLGLIAPAASAGEPGIVRISDSPTAAPAAAPDAVSASAAMPVETPTAMPAAMPATTTGNQTVVGDDGCYGDGDGGHHHGWHSPDHGFRRPVTEPIAREAIVYHPYWPARWYGQAGWNLRPQFPMIYMPTDTTQLGFYYQRVPQWLPNPNMVPPAPRPSDWHRREVCEDGCGYCDGRMADQTAPSPAPAAPPTAPTAQQNLAPVPHVTVQPTGS